MYRQTGALEIEDRKLRMPEDGWKRTEHSLPLRKRYSRGGGKPTSDMWKCIEHVDTSCSSCGYFDLPKDRKIMCDVKTLRLSSGSQPQGAAGEGRVFSLGSCQLMRFNLVHVTTTNTSHSTFKSFDFPSRANEVHS